MARVCAIWRRSQIRCYSRLASTASPVPVTEEFNWDSLGFHLVPTDSTYVMKCRKGEKFMNGNIASFNNNQMSPASGTLNYGQGLLEGLKAYKNIDGGILLFRPEENALRMQMGAERLCMPSPSVDQFINAVKQTALSNRRWVPPPGKGSLYIRPLLLGSGPTLGVGPASEYTFITYASPVSTYHKGPLSLFVEDEIRRAIPGGVGGVKAITNYAPIYKSIVEAKAKGYSDVLFLDAVTGRYIEEASTSNIFLVKGNVISTPAINGTILPGITRKSIIQIAVPLGFQVEERNVSVEELSSADEIFCTGTAAVIAQVHSVTFQGNRFEYTTDGDSVSQKLRTILTGIQQGHIEDKMGWTLEIDM